MTNEEKILEAFRRLIASEVPVITKPATVNAVDADKGTCDVSFADEDLADHNGVLLTSGTDITNRLLIVPEIGSTVYVSLVMNNEQWAFVSLYSKVKEIHLRGDRYNGIVKVGDVTEKLNNIENDINNLKSIIGSWLPAPNDGGAALKTASATWVSSTLQTTTEGELQNEKVKHG